MALDVIVTTTRISKDPKGRQLVDFLREQADALNIQTGVVYYDFPTYSDYETISHKPDALLVSAHHGIIAIRFIDDLETSKNIDLIDESLSQFCSLLIGRLLRSPTLRSGLSQLRFEVWPVLISHGKDISVESCAIARSFDGLAKFLSELKDPKLDANALSEMRSVIEGAKALTRPRKRIIDDSERQVFAVALAKLENEIANFDQQQRRAALVIVQGPQRIRGLAGSGKTVIIAMKAAYLHLTHPEEAILISFYTKSLRSTLKTLITKFYRHYRDEDPDWNRVHIRHGWGGSATPGVYSDACRRANLPPLSFGDARQLAGGKSEPFEFACRALLEKDVIKPFYDHVLIDEGQDFPGSFYELCYALTKGNRDEKSIVWAYDELQNILNVNIRSPDELFGADTDGQPRVSLERSRANLPPGAENDVVLAKCYRNQREVLVVAHALGFGVYGQIVQLLESREHWQDVGYTVIEPDEFKVGENVKILRPPENSPLAIENVPGGNLIDIHLTDQPIKEISWVVSEIQKFIEGGLQPEEILVVAMDDRYSRSYLRSISSALADKGIASNNITADPYNEPPFQIAGKVTLSTVYRAKGNEASVVFAIGIDAIPTKSRSGRNKLFTAFTRTKAWLRVSGMQGGAKTIGTELAAARRHFPYLEFKMPDLEEIELIQRDLGKKTAKAKKIRDEVFLKLRNEGFSEEEISDLFVVENKDAKR